MTLLEKVWKVLMIVTAILLGTGICVYAGEEVELNSVTALDSTGCKFVTSGPGVRAMTDSYGNTYDENVVVMNALSGSNVTYELNGRYSKFSGTIAASESMDSDASVDIAFFLDGMRVQCISGYNRQKAGQKVELDLTGAGTLEIKTWQKNGGTAEVLLANSVLTKQDVPGQYSGWSKLYDTVLIDSDWYRSDDGLLRDAYGNIYSGFGLFNANQSFAMYNLQGNYVKFKGYIVCSPDAGSNASSYFKIYCDDREVYSTSGVKKASEPIYVELDVTNVQVLKMEKGEDEGSGYGKLYFANAVLAEHQHEFGEWNIEKSPTCTEKGYQTRTCNLCGRIIGSEEIPETGHKPEDNWTVRTKATCKNAGLEEQKCSICGKAVETREIKKTAHRENDKWVVEKQAACGKGGSEVRKCIVCGEIVDSRQIPGKEHEFSKWKVVSGSIMNSPIVRERTCSVCGEKEIQKDNSKAWVRTAADILIIVIAGGVAVSVVYAKMNGISLRKTDHNLDKPESTENDVKSENNVKG